MNLLTFLLAAWVAAVALPAHAESGEVNVLCTHQAEWCTMMEAGFTKATGIKTNMVTKSSSEGLAQIVAERANPKTDIWFGGTGDPHLLAAQMDLTLAYNEEPHRDGYDRGTPGRV